MQFFSVWLFLLVTSIIVSYWILIYLFVDKGEKMIKAILIPLWHLVLRTYTQYHGLHILSLYFGKASRKYDQIKKKLKLICCYLCIFLFIFSIFISFV